MNQRRYSILLCALALVWSIGAGAITPAALQQQLRSGGRLTLIDVRSAALFEQGHILGAINIPAALCPVKKLPPLGRVVVYDSGLGRKEGPAAAAALSAKSGITAEVLAGGFAAWEQAGGSSTRPAGMKKEDLPMMAYAELKVAQSNGVVLVDLRKPVKQTRQGNADAETQAPQPPLTDLKREFPGAKIAKSPFDLPQARQSAGEGPEPPLLVLIDSGDGAARTMARTLQANGWRRFVILAGGESILARHGQPGLQRTSVRLPVPGNGLPAGTRDHQTP